MREADEVYQKVEFRDRPKVAKVDNIGLQQRKFSLCL